MAAVIKEYQQLRTMVTVAPLEAQKLINWKKHNALELLTLMKERCRKIKGRVYANGQKQRNYIKKEEFSSLTIQLESLLLSLTIDAMEHRDVATADVAGAYYKTPMKDHMVVKISGEETDIMIKVNLKFKDYVVREKKGKNLSYNLKKPFMATCKVNYNGTIR